MKEKETKKPFNWKSFLFWGGLVLALIALDFASKWIVQSLCSENVAITVIPNFFYITKSYNTAIAFSLGSSIPEGVRRSINIIVSVVMSGAIGFYWFKHHDNFRLIERICALLLLSGAVGNLIDRAFYWKAITGFDGVIDFMQFYLGGGPEAKANMFNPFATFNFADAYLVIGVLMMLVLIIIDLIVSSRHSELTKDPRLEETPKEEEKKPEAETVEEADIEQNIEESK